MMNRLPDWLQGLLAIVGLVLLSACQSPPQTIKGKEGPEMQTHYVEIVSNTVDKQCKVLEQVHGLSFGSEVQDLGRAKVAKTANGIMIGVRAPLAEHEQPIVRIYFAVDDITKAVKEAESSGAVIAYPPTKQGETGTWAIYILDGIQYGLWQQ
jgi:predicted enzyme related to lactoylglutathione lyase